MHGKIAILKAFFLARVLQTQLFYIHTLWRIDIAGFLIECFTADHLFFCSKLPEQLIFALKACVACLFI